MTFFLNRNKYQQPGKPPGEENVTQKAKAAITSGAGTLLNSLFGPPKQPPQQPRSASATRRVSPNSDHSSNNSRASSAGRSAAFPPKRISFDEEDYERNAPKQRARKDGPSRLMQSTRSYSGGGGHEAAGDQSSGTTDPPDDLPEDDLDERASTKSDHGSDPDTSGPDDNPEVHLDDDLVLFVRQFVEQIFQNGYVLTKPDMFALQMNFFAGSYFNKFT